jgi:hypothetical protein
VVDEPEWPVESLLPPFFFDFLCFLLVVLLSVSVDEDEEEEEDWSRLADPLWLP